MFVSMNDLEKHFDRFRKNIIGIDEYFSGPYGRKKIIYSDWTASGRLYQKIEDVLQNQIFPFVANTHTGTNTTGATTNFAFEKALEIIKDEVNANENDIIISAGAGMTMLVSKFQRILGLKVHEKFKSKLKIRERPIVFVTHMEHHSNQTSWIETIADVVVIPQNKFGNVDLDALAKLLSDYSDRQVKIAAITSCSNVTGIFTPYHKIAKIMHDNGGLCFVDFACSAPYIDIDMHPEDLDERLDAIYFSPHKFLGGPGSSGVLIFNKDLYQNNVPDNPGGGTVDWTNPWGEHKYVDDVQQREDGGTPAFLQTIKTALCFRLKKEMGTNKIMRRDEEIKKIVWKIFDKEPNINVLANDSRDRLPIFSFYIQGLHYNLAVQILNDRFGIQTRGGCSCAGTYGHLLLNVGKTKSKHITKNIDEGNLSLKPGWIRLSLHPTMLNKEVMYVMNSISALAQNFKEWSKDYKYVSKTNEFEFIAENHSCKNKKRAENWFELSLI